MHCASTAESQRAAPKRSRFSALASGDRLREVRGQYQAKGATEIATAGRRDILMWQTV
jgi:predicted ATPase with chaperone activity